jgi:tRNA-dihydrouridine synthase C
VNKQEDIFSRLLGVPASRPVLLLAPMEGITRPEFRELVIECGGLDLVATEFIRVSGYKQKLTPFTRHSIPLQIQFMSSQPDILSTNIRRLKKIGYLREDDWLDLNVGCPSRRVNSSGAGAALLKDPIRLKEHIDVLRDAHPDGPCSIKMRLGCESSDSFEPLLEMLAAAPLDFLSIHGRTRSDMYESPIRFEKIARAVEVLPFPVIGNGEIWCLGDAQNMLKQTSVRGLMIGRGALADPFLFTTLRKEFGEAGCVGEQIASERIYELYDFSRRVLSMLEKRQYRENAAVGPFKEFSVWFSRNPLVGSSFFQGVKRLQSVDEVRQFIDTHATVALENSSISFS